MNIYRKEDLSMYYFVKGLFSGTPFVKVVDAFPEQLLEIPTVSVDTGKLSEEVFELGNRNKIRRRIWFIDIFANNKSQRDDFGYKILESSKDGIPVYDYDMGFPPDVTPSKIGHLAVVADSYEPIPVIAGENELLHYRGQVILITENDIV
jgi:hypothetical protein